MMNILEVFIGAGIGGVCRFLLGKNIKALVFPARFPFGTFIVNMLGCFAIGLLFQFINHEFIPKRFQLILVTGFLGGFTTFSSFSLESATLFRGNDITSGLANMLISTILGVALVALGMYIAAICMRPVSPP